MTRGCTHVGKFLAFSRLGVVRAEIGLECGGALGWAREYLGRLGRDVGVGAIFVLSADLGTAGRGGGDLQGR